MMMSAQRRLFNFYQCILLLFYFQYRHGKIFSNGTINNSGEIWSPCLTPLLINLSEFQCSLIQKVVFSWMLFSPVMFYNCSLFNRIKGFIIIYNCYDYCNSTVHIIFVCLQFFFIYSSTLLPITPVNFVQ